MKSSTEAIITGVFHGYVECALWSSTDQSDDTGGQPLDSNYGSEDLAGSAHDVMLREVADFLSGLPTVFLAETLERRTPEQIGHDFWLTRNRHGAGFWDRGLGELGEQLTAMAQPYGEAYLFVGDDGLLYAS